MSDVVGHTDCDAPMGLIIHRDDAPDVRVPIIGGDGSQSGLTLHERKQGPMGMGRRATATIPIVGFDPPGDSWLGPINAFGDDGQNQIQTATVIGTALDRNGDRIGEPVPIFRGWIAATGSDSKTNTARLRIHPVHNLMQQSAGVRFNDATLADAVKYVVDRFREGQTVFGSVDYAIDNPNRRLIDDKLTGILEGKSPTELSDPTYEVLSKNFSTNRDTIIDVIIWIQRRLPVKLWWGPSDSGTGITLYARERLGADYDLTPDSTDPPAVIGNDALRELRPVTSLRLKGDVGFNVRVGGRVVQTPVGNSYPEVLVDHEVLKERFGGRLVATGTSQLNNVERLEEEAQSRLKQRIDDVSGGSATVTLAPMLRPYDRVRMTPACKGVGADVDADVTYEIQRTTHRMDPESNDLPHTEISVSVAADPDDIVVAESTIKDAQTGGEPSDNDPLNGLSWSVRSS